MTNFKKYRHRESGEIVEAKCCNLFKETGVVFCQNINTNAFKVKDQSGAISYLVPDFKTFYEEVKENE